MTEFGYDRNEGNLTLIARCIQAFLLRGAHAMRMLGSGVLDLCYVSCGRIDACYVGVAGMI